MTNPEDKKRQCNEIIDQLAPYINISSVAMQVLIIYKFSRFCIQKIQNATASDNPDPAAFELARKEVKRLLENDQFPRFRRSDIYLKYLEMLLPRADAENWHSDFEALVENQVI
jgi:hypothetical protein